MLCFSQLQFNSIRPQHLPCPPFFIVNNCSNAQWPYTTFLLYSAAQLATATCVVIGPLKMRSPLIGGKFFIGFLPPPIRYSWSGATVIPVVFSSLANKETLSCCINHLCVNALSDAQLTARALFFLLRGTQKLKLSLQRKAKFENFQTDLIQHDERKWCQLD